MLQRVLHADSLRVQIRVPPAERKGLTKTESTGEHECVQVVVTVSRVQEGAGSRQAPEVEAMGACNCLQAGICGEQAFRQSQNKGVAGERLQP